MDVVGTRPALRVYAPLSRTSAFVGAGAEAFLEPFGCILTVLFKVFGDSLYLE